MQDNVKNKKYIFFDIFDTILSRTIEPEYAKKIWSNYIVKTFNLDINMEDFYKKRNQIEYSLGEENHNNGYDYEFTYESVILKLYEFINDNTIEYKEFYRICEETEINIESNVLYPNKDIIDLIKKNYKNKKIICVSDMYLSKKMIYEIFKNLDIDKYISNIYVSCEYLNNKKSGILYDIVLKDLKIKPEDCIMIGDNINSDYNIPKEKGIEAIHLDRKEKYDFYSKYLNEKNKVNIYNEVFNLSKYTNNFENTIFTLYSFIEKLYFKLLRDNKDEVFFLSREGEYLKKLFDYYNETSLNKNIKSNYLIVSRKSTYLPSLKELKKEDFSSLLNQYYNITITEFLKSLNFNDREINKIEKDIKELDFNIKINNFKTSKELKIIKSNKTFINIYETNRKEQKENFIKYIKEKTNKKDIVVVDIGWNGSIQNNIQNILGKSYHVKGYYFGLLKKDFNEIHEKEGLIFSNYPNESKGFYLFNENRSLYEIILGASHGSANKYILKNNKIEVELFKKKEEELIYKEKIKPLQDKMFKTFKLLTNNLTSTMYNNIEINKLINKIHFNMVFKPNKEQLSFFNKIYHYENFGVFEFTEFNNKTKYTIKEFINENKKFIKNHREYMYDSFWPTLKLANNKLYLQKKLYTMKKYNNFKKNNII